MNHGWTVQWSFFRPYVGTDDYGGGSGAVSKVIRRFSSVINFDFPPSVRDGRMKDGTDEMGHLAVESPL